MSIFDVSNPADDEERTRDLVDPERLGSWMDDQGLPDKGEPVAVRYISGGAANEVFEVRRGDSRMVLRRPPRVVPKGRNETMLREYRVLSALDGTDVPHPEAIAVCEDESVLGAAFYLMGYVDGWTGMSGTGWAPPFDTDLEARRGLAFELIDAIARLAKVDWKARGLEGFGRPDNFHDRQVDRWWTFYEGFRFRDVAGLEEAAAWLRDHRPRTFEPGIMHGDYSYANVMFHHGAPARIAAIVDWEQATVGDPKLDLGWVMMTWPNPGEDGSHILIPVDYEGMPTREELLERYSLVSGRPVDDIEYYVILGRFKMAVVLEGGYARVVKGQADNPRTAAFGAAVERLAANAAELVRTTIYR
jgi:aminoglycoside phosphotransferase (APT) family kinase protein